MQLIVRKLIEKKSPDIAISNNVIASTVKVYTKNDKDKIISFIGTDHNFPDISKIDIKTIRMGASNQIACEKIYIDSLGNMTLMGTHDGNPYCEFEYSLQNFNELCNTFENVETEEYYTENHNTTPRAAKSKICDTDIELCEVTLGTWRNYIQKANSNILLQKRKYYDKTTGEVKDKETSNTSYNSVIFCKAENKDTALTELKQILKANNKSVIEWF